jgi:hypothetical protein
VFSISYRIRDSVTAEVAGSSPVVPATKPQKFRGLWRYREVTIRIEGAGEGAEHQIAPSDCISTVLLFLTASAVEGAVEGAESDFFPASNTICITLSFASRLVAEIALV